MAMWTDKEVAALLKIAEENHGNCDRCRRKISIYNYSVNKQMLEVLEAMRDEVERTGLNEVNFSRLNLPYRLESQRTKMRLHGLIAQVKQDGKKVGNTWLITAKGGGFLSGEAIQKTVITFDNHLLGHEETFVTKYALTDDASYQEEAITPKQAEEYSDLRTPRRQLQYIAVYNHMSSGELVKGRSYSLLVDRLQVGHPVTISIEDLPAMKPITYADIAAFNRRWRILDI